MDEERQYLDEDEDEPITEVVCCSTWHFEPPATPFPAPDVVARVVAARRRWWGPGVDKEQGWWNAPADD